MDAEKINTKTTEEVSLPPSAPHKPIVAEKILISQLDKVAQLVFATTKRLNEVCLCAYVYYVVLCNHGSLSLGNHGSLALGNHGSSSLGNAHVL